MVREYGGECGSHQVWYETSRVEASEACENIGSWDSPCEYRKRIVGILARRTESPPRMTPLGMDVHSGRREVASPTAMAGRGWEMCPTIEHVEVLGGLDTRLDRNCEKMH